MLDRTLQRLRAADFAPSGVAPGALAGVVGTVERLAADAHVDVRLPPIAREMLEPPPTGSATTAGVVRLFAG